MTSVDSGPAERGDRHENNLVVTHELIRVTVTIVSGLSRTIERLGSTLLAAG